jgi:ribosomal-protein-alanine N-acetyltransferase
MALFDPFPTLTSERLVLRALTPDDVPRMFAIRSDPRVLRYLGRDPDPDASCTAERIAEVIRNVAEGTAIRWGLTLADSGELVGSSGLWHWDKAHRWAELGYELAPEAWGKGLMREANRLILSWGFGPPMSLHRIEARLDPANDASRRQLEQLGFSREGLLRENWFHRDLVADTLIFGLLAREHR